MIFFFPTLQIMMCFEYICSIWEKEVAEFSLCDNNPVHSQNEVGDLRKSEPMRASLDLPLEFRLLCLWHRLQQHQKHPSPSQCLAQTLQHSLLSLYPMSPRLAQTVYSNSHRLLRALRSSRLVSRDGTVCAHNR